MIYKFEGIKNARDLGGLKTIDGKTVKSNMLLRSGHLNSATITDIQRLSELGIKEIIDFRDEYEVKREPDKALVGANNQNLPALPPLMPFDEFSKEELQEYFENSVEKVFKGIYKDLAESDVSKNAYRFFFEIILSSNGAPILWHCTQGKDRTGIAAILLLSALGVPYNDIIDEYFITNKVMLEEYEKLQNSGVDESQLSGYHSIMFVHKECIEIYLNSIAKNYGNILSFIKSELGVSDSDITKLKTWYLD